MDAIDRQIIQATQAGLPLVAEPYQAVAEQLGISAEEVMQRMTVMQNSGVIRRIGAVPNHYKIGYRYNGMTVWDVDDALIDAVAEGAQLWVTRIISGYDEFNVLLPGNMGAKDFAAALRPRKWAPDIEAVRIAKFP